MIHSFIQFIHSFTDSFIHSFIHSAVCFTTGPQLLSKRVLHRERSSASSFSFHYTLVSLRSFSICLHLIPRLPVTSWSHHSFKTWFIWQFLRKTKHSMVRSPHPQVHIYLDGKFRHSLDVSICLESNIPYACLQRRESELHNDLVLRCSYNKYKLLFLPFLSFAESPGPRYEGLRLLHYTSLTLTLIISRSRSQPGVHCGYTDRFQGLHRLRRGKNTTLFSLTSNWNLPFHSSMKVATK
jgi:hypothetical protein